MGKQIAYRDLYSRLVKAIKKQHRLGAAVQDVLIKDLDQVLTSAYEADGKKVLAKDRVVRSVQSSPVKPSAPTTGVTKVNDADTRPFRWIAGRRVYQAQVVDLGAGNPGINTALKQNFSKQLGKKS